MFYPEFGVPVRSLEKGRGQTLVQNLEKGPGPTLVRQVRSSEKGPGLSLVWQVWRKEQAEPWYGVLRKDRAEPWFDRFRVWKDQAEPWFGRFGVWRKYRAEPGFGVWVRSSEKGQDQTLVWQVWSLEKSNRPNLSSAGSELGERTW